MALIPQTIGLYQVTIYGTLQRVSAIRDV